MARQFVGATAIFPIGYIQKLDFSNGTTRYSINKGSSGEGRNATWKYSVTGGGTTSNAAALFTEMDKISKAGPGGTKLTIIDITMSFPGNQIYMNPTGRGGPRFSRRNNTSIVRVYVDWEAKKVKWSGWIMGNQPEAEHSNTGFGGNYWALDGIADIPASTGLVNIKSTIGPDGYSRPKASSNTVGQIGLDPATRKITGLPVFPLSGSTQWQKGDWNVKFNYQIETDDYQTTTVASTPDPTPDPGDGIDVSGTKISELTPATTPLDDSDLFILSQGGADGTYDSSNNINYEDLKEEIGGGGGANTLSIQGTPTSNTGAEAIFGACTLTLPAGKKWGHIKLVATTYLGSSGFIIPKDVKIGSTVQPWVNSGKDKSYAMNNSDDAAVITMINEGTPSTIDADITLDFYASSMADSVSYRTIFAIAEFY